MICRRHLLTDSEADQCLQTEAVLTHKMVTGMLNVSAGADHVIKKLPGQAITDTVRGCGPH